MRHPWSRWHVSNVLPVYVALQEVRQQREPEPVEGHSMTDITIPDEVVPAMKLAAAEYVANGKDLTEEGLFTAALRAGLAAWPGMFPTEMEEAAGVRRRIILPLPQDQQP